MRCRTGRPTSIPAMQRETDKPVHPAYTLHAQAWLRLQYDRLQPASSPMRRAGSLIVRHGPAFTMNRS